MKIKFSIYVNSFNDSCSLQTAHHFPHFYGSVACN